MITETGYKTILLKEDSNTENSTLYAQWIAKKDTAYKVEYYQMGLDGRYPEIATETENKTGETNHLLFQKQEPIMVSKKRLVKEKMSVQQLQQMEV